MGSCPISTMLSLSSAGATSASAFATLRLMESLRKLPTITATSWLLFMERLSCTEVVLKLEWLVLRPFWAPLPDGALCPWDVSGYGGATVERVVRSLSSYVQFMPRGPRGSP